MMIEVHIVLNNSINVVIVNIIIKVMVTKLEALIKENQVSMNRIHLILTLIVMIRHQAINILLVSQEEIIQAEVMNLVLIRFLQKHNKDLVV